MKKGLATLAFLLLLVNTAAETVYETSFKEIGYESLIVEGERQRECREIIFSLPGQEGEKQTFPILSLNITFAPTTQGTATIETKINDVNITSFSPERANCIENKCWKRILLEKEQLKKETNALVVCLNSSSSIPRIELSNLSLIGLYAMPYFPVPEAFKTIPEEREIVFGETIRVRLAAKNLGSEKAIVEFHRAREIASDKNAFRVVDGATSWNGTIGAGESKEIEYTIKPKVFGSISLPPAILIFENTFGEKEQVFAKPEMILVKPPKEAIEAHIIKKEEAQRVGERVSVTIVLKNKTEAEIENATISLLSELEPTEKTKSFSLQGNETKSIGFQATTSKSGEYSIGCRIEYGIEAFPSLDCEKQKIVFEEKTTPLAIIFGIAFVIIAIAAYAYIRFGKH